jgi:hypothetical protein
LGSRSPAEVALQLNQVYAFVGNHTLKFTKGGDLSTPALRALVKGVPLPAEEPFSVPDHQAFLFEVLRYAGALTGKPSEAVGTNQGVATSLFSRPTAEQARVWARAWIWSSGWRDGRGALSITSYGYDWEERRGVGRQLLAWALNASAQTGPVWFDLEEFLGTLHNDNLDRSRGSYAAETSWNPQFVGTAGTNSRNDQERERAFWLDSVGRIHANALMVTLPALGLIERGRSRAGSKPGWCFRLTELGRAVFGAPEIEPPREPADQPFLVVQPNFDVVAYLDRAGAATAGTLGLLTEPTSSSGSATGPVQTFRLTQASVYKALEAGTSRENLMAFLQRHNTGELPINVLQMLGEWSARREGLAVRSGLRLMAFPTREARDASLADSRHGSACGELFVLEPERRKSSLPATVLTSDHLGQMRQMLEVSEDGRITNHRPFDLVQLARLRRIAEQDKNGWRLSRKSLEHAKQVGLKPALVRRWLTEHLAKPMPPLLERALAAWMGEKVTVHLGKAVLLYVAEEKVFDALVASPRVLPCLLGSPGPGYLLVRKENAADLARLLAELGFTVDDELPSGDWFSIREDL